MSGTSLDRRRQQLCGRMNAERIAIRLSEITGEDHSVIRTDCELQPYRVIPAAEGRPADVELQVVLL